VDDRNMKMMRRASNALGRVLLVIPLFPLLFWNLPSAVFLYWAPTFAFNGINDTLLRRWLPDRPARYGDPHKGLSKFPTPYVSIEGYEVPGKKAGAAPQSSKTTSR
jgi:inner membrane protein COX18